MNVTREELTIRMMPFHDQLVVWCKNNPDFLEALKIVYPDRFIALGAIYTSTSPYVPQDEVIGFLVYDTQKDIFKQDFIVNVGKAYTQFVLHTKLPRHMRKKYSKNIKPIGEFYMKYAYDEHGQQTHYLNTHHIEFDGLDEQLKVRAQKARELAKKLKKTGLRQLTQEELRQISDELQLEQNRTLI